MPIPISRARDAVLLDGGLRLLGQFDGDEGRALRDGFRAVRLDPDRILGRLRTHVDGLKAALDDRSPKMGQHQALRSHTSEGRDAVHDWLDDLQDGLEMAMEDGFPGSDAFPVRFRFGADDGLGTIAASQLASELLEDLATFGDALADYGLDAEFVAQGRALIKETGTGVVDTSGALGTQRAATVEVEAQRDGLRKAIRLLRIAHRRAQRKAKGKLPELDLTPFRTAYANRRRPGEDEASAEKASTEKASTAERASTTAKTTASEKTTEKAAATDKAPTTEKAAATEKAPTTEKAAEASPSGDAPAAEKAVTKEAAPAAEKDAPVKPASAPAAKPSAPPAS